MKNYSIREIQEEDISGVADLIRTVMPEFGASGPGFAIHDGEVNDMFHAYHRPDHAYFVVTDGQDILGGGGIAPLTGGEEKVCELRKMYFMPEIRGKGLGQGVMDLCLKAAKKMGYQKCYLETLKSMEKAQVLYLRNGFCPIKGPMGATGHFSCDSWFLKNL
jgi:putative acetyltransferase